MKSESICPIDKAVVLFNKKWTIQLIRDMFFGKKQFKEFQEDKPNLSNKVLSQRLKELENNGLVEKKVLNTVPISTEYHLTEHGKKLNKVIYELAMFVLYESDYDEYKNEDIKNQIKNTFKQALEISD
ncbi:helix-turn-helix domain-containing protein [uncultured Methanobrevibacter sp.]|uniref:winged helix-turn-helix transcriptional regulator n=1 Tax=uncultured Methanobrevibacter sp. TaxID=253161 RepID=UPI00262EAD0F|nr:helix-turn-helix domain-containing protein [uncultured Methanobrevibacter sp.]